MPTPVAPPPTTARSHGSRRSKIRWRKVARFIGCSICDANCSMFDGHWSFLIGHSNHFHFRVLFPLTRAFQRLGPAAPTMLHFVRALLWFECAVRLPGFLDFTAIFPETDRET